MTEARSEARALQGRPLVVGYDGSPASVRAARYAAEIAGALGSEVIIVHALQSSAEVAEPVTEEELESRARVDALVLGDIAAQVSRLGVATRSVLRDGDPVRLLLDVARDSRAGAIVVGTRGRTGAAKLILGSVSSGVIGGAEVPVMVVH